MRCKLGNRAELDAGDLAAGASATQTLTVVVDAAMANGANITNTVRAQAAEGVSNTATMTVPVVTRADLAMMKTAMC